MKNPMQKLDELLTDLRDTNAALRRAACGGTVARCACGCFTIYNQCSKCEREKREKGNNHERKH